MKELVEYVVKSLVDNPEAVTVNEAAGPMATVIEIRTAPEDAGKVIGREGRIANAIRTIVKAASAKQNQKVSVEILTEDKRTGEAR
ncbi:MAG: KH domain-containing protein [Candidatus Margulisiibacteriota bacterium]